jgi:hypothetical protein
MITAWLGDGEPSLLRARLTEVPDLDGPTRAFATAGDAAGILRANPEWLTVVQGHPAA